MSAAALADVAAWLGAADRQGRAGRCVDGGCPRSDPYTRDLVAVFVGELARLGWMDGPNTRIEQRWTNADIKRTNALAKELLATSPDVIFASTTPATAALHRETSTILIIFTTVSEPVGAGFVASLPRPGDNITGFTQTDRR
jgi:putative tryptophan/tyrosine transport system substrate-binding protein